MSNKEQAKGLLRIKHDFTSGNLKGYHPKTTVYPDGGMVYIVKSYSTPIAVWDGDIWHVLDSDFVGSVTAKHQEFVRSVIGDHDAFSMYPVVPTKASMDALIARLVNQ